LAVGTPRAVAVGMRVMRMVHEDGEHEVYEEEELEVFDEDIACVEPADGARPSVKMAFDGVNAFLAEYLLARRGESLVVEAPRELDPGDLLDVEVAIADLDRFVMHAQVLQRWPRSSSELAEVQVLSSPFTDRLVRPVVERELGIRAAARLLGPN
jgi:hypothetical protein